MPVVQVHRGVKGLAGGIVIYDFEVVIDGAQLQAIFSHPEDKRAVQCRDITHQGALTVLRHSVDRAQIV